MRRSRVLSLPYFYRARRASLALDTLDDDGRGHAAGRAHGDETALQIAPFEFVEHGADQDRAGGADGMAERDRAAIDVDPGAVELEVADVFFRNHGKGLVDLEQVDVVDGQPRLRQHLAR